MSRELLKKFRESLFEIFSNTALHSRTQLGIFSCGQFFPARNRLDFTVADLGVGIRTNVRGHLQCDLDTDAAIVWAVQEHRTTKRDTIPGDLGLTLLKEFIDLKAATCKSCRTPAIGGVKATGLLRLSSPGRVRTRS